MFVSSALFVAPAVLDATGYSVGPAVLNDDAGIFCPFEYSLLSSIQSLNADGISSPDVHVGGPNACKAWATGASDKLYKKTKADLEGLFENMSELERKHAKARLLS